VPDAAEAKLGSTANAGPDQVALPDYLASGLDLVLCGCNPGLYSAATGHYFAWPGNAFWALLAETGITSRRFEPREDRLLPALGIGLTDVVARPTGSTAHVRSSEWRSGGLALAQRLREFQPAAVCFVGDTAYRAFSGRSRARWGRQPEPWEGITVFVVPSTSWRVRRLADARRAAFAEVAGWLRQRQAGTTESPPGADSV
jgi:TDG/mug DNA glycosylase family protein